MEEEGGREGGGGASDGQRAGNAAGRADLRFRANDARGGGGNKKRKGTAPGEENDADGVIM